MYSVWSTIVLIISQLLLKSMVPISVSAFIVDVNNVNRLLDVSCLRHGAVIFDRHQRQPKQGSECSLVGQSTMRKLGNMRHNSCDDHRERGVSLYMSFQDELVSDIGVGIDLGTTNSAVAYLDVNSGEPFIVEIPHNGRTVKSIVSVVPDSCSFEDGDDSRVLFRSALVGNDALDWERRHQRTAYRHVKRVIGSGRTFLSAETRQVVPHIAPGIQVDDDEDDFEPGGKSKKKPPKKKKKKTNPTLQRLIDDARQNPVMLYPLNQGSVGDSDTQEEQSSMLSQHYSSSSLSLVSPETISSCIIQRLLDVATNHTKHQITRAVIGIPAYFTDEQRDATTRAAKACGLSKVKLLPEPEAAALAYGVNKQLKDQEQELVLVFDLGGGTYDVSLLLVERGLTEIICTSGNAQLGGTNFDAKIATYLSKLVRGCCKSEEAKDVLIRSAEAIRIYLSNHRSVRLALPLTQEGWLSIADCREVIDTSSTTPSNDKDNEKLDFNESQNSTHIFHQWSRKEMERLCDDEFKSLLKPIREVAIMAGALLPGDARPSIVETALELETAYTDAQRFYGSEDDIDNAKSIGQQQNESVQIKTASNTEISNDNPESIPQEVLDYAASKKMQQKGRQKARRVAKEERKFRLETRRVAKSVASSSSDSGTKVQGDGITGRPISRVVLVGGATRMPAIGRIISALTGVVPQKTVDPDEAVALGCAVHVGVLDGREGSGVVLNSMQAAILRAVAEKELREGGEIANRLMLTHDGIGDDGDFDDSEFKRIEYLS